MDGDDEQPTFSYGKILGSDELGQEQDYIRGKEALHADALHGNGTIPPAEVDTRDEIGEVSELDSLTLQMHMDRVAKASQTASNILKKQSDTQSQIIDNLK